MEELVGAAAAERLARARAGIDEARYLDLGSVQAGDVGVVTAQVLALGNARTYRRGAGDGRLQRVFLRDATGEAELVLWDQELAHAASGALSPGSWVRLRGVQAKAGYRGGVELALMGATVEAMPPPPEPVLAVRVLAVEAGPDWVEVEAEPEGAADARFRLRVSGSSAARLAVPAGSRLLLAGTRPHPVLGGWRVADQGFRADPA